MFDANHETYLRRQLGRGSIALFLGAGFSTLARNRLGNPLPAGDSLAEQLWQLLAFPESYAGEPLDEVYQALLDSGVQHSIIRNFLEERLLATDLPAEYDALTHPFWYRIYTTNIDNVVAEAYKHTAPTRLDVLAFPHDDIRERDQFLERIQLVYLNGRLPCRPDEITFSPRQYARASIKPQPLYEQFVRDYATHPFIFIGTRFNEPLFWQYLAAREEREHGISEHRPLSFLVTQRISPTKRAQLERLNIVGLEAGVEDFLSWLAALVPTLPSRLETLRLSNPALELVIAEAHRLHIPEAELKEFSLYFSPVPQERRVENDRSLYLLGAAPRWEDFFQDLDVPRSISDDLFAYVSSELDATPRITLAAILGSAGCGKSTILRRLGIRLVQAGRSSFLTNSEELPSPEAVRRALASLPERSVLLFDNAEVALAQIPDLIGALESLARPPVLIIAARTNDFDRLTRRLAGAVDITEFRVPHLNRPEIERLLRLLEDRTLLGELRGLTFPQRIAAFEQRAHRQILVAMREATTGKGFDVIIEDEFSRLEPDEAKDLYLCVALATDAGYRLTREEFVACARVAPATALHILARNLRDIVIPTGPTADLLLLRHRLIAEVVVDELAPRGRLREAYIRLLTTLSSEIGGRRWRSRNSSLYRAIVNHQTIYRRFRMDIDEARSIYSAVASLYGDEAHFWLQFGSLELEGEGGDLSYAENYLRSALSLHPDDGFIQNAMGHLLLRKAREAGNRGQADELLREGSEILLTRIERSGYQDDYAVHIYCYQRLRWSKIWNYDNREARAEELDRLRVIARRGSETKRFSRRLKRLSDFLERAYLQTAVKGKKDLDPLPED